MSEALESLFRPKSVALIGASANPAKLSHIALRNLMKGRFSLYPVNPKETRILGLRCYYSVIDIPGTIDLAVISLPAELSVDVTEECARKGIRVVIVTPSGFRESGPQGAKLEQALVGSVKGTPTRILGPNTMGVYVPSIGLDTLFIPREKSRRPKAGSIAMLSQSGAVSVSFLEKAAASGLGVSVCVGLGNECDITENELLRYLSKDKATKCLALYLESFSDGREFLMTAKSMIRKKPIVLLKSGRTESGSRAARSHTGAMAASSDKLVAGALKQAGIVRAYDEEELVDLAKALAYVDHIDGDRICVVASAGGYGVIAADHIESQDHGANLKMARLSERTQQELGKVMPDFSSTRNPVDLTAAVTDEIYDSVLDILQKDPGIDGIMMSLELQPPNITRRLVDIAEKRYAVGKVPIVASVFAGNRTNELLREFEKKRMPAYPTIWRAVRALGALARRGSYLRRAK